MSTNLYYCTQTVENFESNCPTNPNPTALTYNTGGPAWCQWVVKQSLVPNSILFEKPYTIAGSPTFTITPKASGISGSGNVFTSNDSFQSNYTYMLGSVINYNGSNYMCLVWDESKEPVTANNRGQGFSGAYGVNPDQDKNAWMKVAITGRYVANSGPVLPVEPATTGSTTTGSTTTGSTTTGSTTTESATTGPPSYNAGASASSPLVPEVPSEWIKGVNNTYVMIGVAVLILLLVLMK
jgi:hypothetical protein